jgi:hypothetical protein
VCGVVAIAPTIRSPHNGPMTTLMSLLRLLVICATMLSVGCGTDESSPDAAANQGCLADAQLACASGYMNNDAGVCGEDRDADLPSAICAAGTWSCPSGYLPRSACTARQCGDTLPSGPCAEGDSFSCTGYVYPFVSVYCFCEGVWQCSKWRLPRAELRPGRSPQRGS